MSAGAARHPGTAALADALVQAHVAHTRQQLLDGGLLVSLLDTVLNGLERVQVAQLVDQASVEAVVRDYVFELELGGGLLELLGLMARRVHEVLTQQQLYLHTVVGPQQVGDWLDKVLEMQPLWHALARQLQSPPLQALLADWLGQHLQAQWSSMGSQRGPAWMQRLVHSDGRWSRHRLWLHQITLPMSRQLVRFALHQGQQLLKHPEQLKALAETLWAHLADQPLLKRDSPSADDIEDFLVLTYEFWRDLRRKPLLQQSVLGGVALFFDHYGGHTVAALLGEIGLSAAELQRELRRFAPRLLQALHADGVLDEAIALWVRPFYEAAATRQLLSEHLQAARG